MAEYDTIRSVGVGARAEIDAGLRAHMNKVYGLMSVAMVVTAGVAWAVGSSDALFAILRNPVTGGMTILGWVVMFLPLGMVFAFGFADIAAISAMPVHFVKMGYSQSFAAISVTVSSMMPICR